MSRQLLLCLLLAGCGEGTGTYEITIWGEEFIEEGIPAAETDGWAVTFSAFSLEVRDVSVTREDGTREAFSGAGTYDLVTPGPQRVDERSVAAGDYPHASYRLGALDVAGRADKEETTKTFSWHFDVDTTFSRCETDRHVAEEGRATTQITIHADHLFYDDLESPDPNVAVSLVAASDADGDGEVTLEELAATDITGEARYQVGSREITDLRGFVVAQTATLGHIDGEGHCETAPH